LGSLCGVSLQSPINNSNKATATTATKTTATTPTTTTTTPTGSKAPRTLTGVLFPQIYWRTTTTLFFNFTNLESQLT